MRRFDELQKSVTNWILRGTKSYRERLTEHKLFLLCLCLNARPLAPTVSNKWNYNVDLTSVDQITESNSSTIFLRNSCLLIF